MIKSLLFTVVIITTNATLTTRLPNSVHQKIKELAVPNNVRSYVPASYAKTLLASLPVGAARTFSSTQLEAALGLTMAGPVRPMIQVTGTSALEVQSFMQQPGGVFNEFSGVQ